MDRTNKRILIFIVLLTVILFLLTKVSDALQNKIVYEHSWTIEESKQGRRFLTEYKPAQRRIKLMYHSDSIEFSRLWTEKAKKKEKVWLFYRSAPSDKVHFQIDYRQYPSDEFNSQIEGYGSHGGHGTMSTDFALDTIIFQITEKNPVDSLGWEQELMGQKIKFIRVK
jgi:hypothetical protein